MEGLIHLFVSFFCLIITVSVAEKVPVLVWTNDRSVVFPQQLAGHSLSQHSFKKSFLDGLASNQQDNIVLFMQDKLSVKDFTRFADVYGTDEEQDSFSHIKSLMSEMMSTFLPSVASPGHALLEMKHQKSRKISNVDGPQDLSLQLDDSPQLVVVRLPQSQHSHKSQAHFDDVVGMVTSKLKALSRPFIAYYTASTSAHRGLSFGNHRHSRRLMSAKTEASGIFINVSDSFYLYSSNVTLVSNGNSTVLENIVVDEGRSECNETGHNCVIVLTFGFLSTPMTVYNPSLTLQFNRTTGINSGYWYLARFVLSYSNTTLANTTAEPLNTVEYNPNFVEQTPLGYSYHCHKLPKLSVKNATGTGMDGAPRIDFENFQVQAFIIKNSRFGHYNDCIGFFTVGIWMFLVSTVVLLAVLFFGIIMVLNLTTMDRYDDAKGKTISVNVTEG